MLRGVPLEVQEAMVLVDLLSVLLVRSLFSPDVRELTLARHRASRATSSRLIRRTSRWTRSSGYRAQHGSSTKH